MKTFDERDCYELYKSVVDKFCDGMMCEPTVRLLEK